MNVSSETFAFPINHHPHRRVLTSKHSSMLVSASPIAVNNKIKAIQTRKPRINLQSYYDFADIHRLNIGNHSSITNGATAISNLSPEKLVERSKELRLGRISTRQNPRPSFLSTTSITNQQSLIWPTHNSPTTSPTNFGLTMNKLSTGHMPDIQQRSSRAQTVIRQPLTEQQNILIPVDLRHKSLPKNKSSIPKPYRQTMTKIKSTIPLSSIQQLQISHNDYFKQLNNSNNIIHLYESEEDDENVPIVMDEEFEKYLKTATVKCADWLIKYVFDRKYDENDE